MDTGAGAKQEARAEERRGMAIAGLMF